jgi:hypothetical protein
MESGRTIVLEPRDSDGVRNASSSAEGSNARLRFREFFRNFRIGNIYIYRDALVRNWNRQEYFVEVDLLHLSEFEFDHGLFNALQVS